MPKQQHPSLTRHCLQAKDAAPKCFLMLKCTKRCKRGHDSGEDEPRLSLRLQQKSYASIAVAIKVSGDAEYISGVLLPRNLHLSGRLGRLHVLQD